MIPIKNKPQIWSAWDVGKFFGDGKSSAYITVEPNWSLHTDTSVAPARQVYRWFQSQNGAERAEVEVPNLKSISIERSLDTDAASCEIEIYNQLMDPVGVPQALAGQLGNPGFLSPSRGTSAEARARWNQPDPSNNDWAIQNADNAEQQGVIAPSQALAPMALIRTYQGYGAWVNGTAMPWQTAVSSGRVAITGTWIVDSTTIGSDGILRLKCRDAAKLLIDQYCYLPIVPTEFYPVKYNRYVYTDYDREWDPVPSELISDVNVGLAYHHAVSDYILGGFTDATGDVVGPNFPVQGHYPSQAVDGDVATFALSAGTTPNGWEYWEYSAPGSDINQIWIHPWGGPYPVYISIRVNGVWQGGGATPPPTPGNPTVPFVTNAGLSFEVPVWIILPATYKADRIRITMQNSYDSVLSPSKRCAMRELAARYHPIDPTIANGFAYAMATFKGGDGAYVFSDAGVVFELGDAPVVTHTGLVHDSDIVAAEEVSATGVLVYALQSSGRLNGLTDTGGVINIAPPVSGRVDFVDLAVRSGGGGYWLLESNGTVWAFGTANHAGNGPNNSAAIAADPTGNGYWIVSITGIVTAFGSADPMSNFPNAGTPAINALFRDAVATTDGTGLWGLWHTGAITTVGSAANFGDAASFFNSAAPNTTNFWAMSVLPNDAGYRLLQSNGNVYYFGESTDFGTITNPHARTAGNYTDYADIVKDFLLWSGFLLYGTNHVHGNLQTTGTWSEEDLGEEVFDKKSIMDIITMIKQLVGYNFWIDDEGGVQFSQPNWFTPGNYFESPTGSTGIRTTFVPTIDERMHLTSYSAAIDDSQIRSSVVIANASPTSGNAHTITTAITPPGAFTLRGMQKPALWFNEIFLRAQEQQIMAELIAMHIFFSMRQGQVECTGNPCIQLNDQVRIYERISAETYVHYVRSISTSHDVDSGSYKMNIGTNWLGDGAVWAITGGSGGRPPDGTPPDGPTEQSFAYSAGSGTRTFTVPTGVTSLTVEIAGAQGEDGQIGGVGGKGCLGVATFTVTPAQVLNVIVGGQGDGGGPGGAVNPLGTVFRGGTGGGKSQVFKPGVGQSTPPIFYVTAAGGGAGGGGPNTTIGGGGGGGIGIGNTSLTNNGDHAYPGFGPGGTYGGAGGTGATPTAAGVGGAGSFTATSAQQGVAGSGATGGGSTNADTFGGSGGGGGGGWFNGGGGGSGVLSTGFDSPTAGGGGGGGSSNVLSSITNYTFTPGQRAGHGYVKFTWTNPVVTPPPPPPGSGPIYQAEDAVIFAATGSPPSGSAPSPEFTFVPTSGTVGQTITFTDRSTNTPTTWSWVFGDGGTSSQQNPTHTYATASTFTVQLTVSNATGTTSTTHTVAISAGVSIPAAEFTISPTSSTAGQTITFTDTSTNTPTSWAWTFGDGGTSTTRNPTHIFASASTYTVQLTATNTAGSNSKTHTIVIANSGTADFTVSNSQSLQQILDQPTSTLAGKRVLVPAGVWLGGDHGLYVVNKDFGGVVVEFQSGAILRGPGTSGIELYGSCRNITFTGPGKIQGNGQNVVSEGIFISSVQGGKGGDGNPCGNIVIDGLTVEPTPGTGSLQRNGIGIWGADWVTVRNCTIHDASSNAAFGFGGAGSGISIGQARRGVAGSGTYHVLIENNHIYNQLMIQDGPSADRNGIILDLYHCNGGFQNFAGLYADRLIGETMIRNNDIHDVSGRGIQVLFGGQPNSKISVLNNQVHGQWARDLGGSDPQTAIGGNGTGVCENVVCSDNTVTRDTGNGNKPAYFFFDFNPGTGVTGSNNHLIGGGLAFDWHNSPGTAPPAGFIT